MKNLFIIILLSISVLAIGQRENQLPIKSTSAATDTIRIVKDNQSALMLRSVLQGAIYDSLATHTDTLQALRADIDAGGSSLLLDSINQHRIEIDNLHDSITVHRTDIDANMDSIAVHRIEIDANLDSIADHRTEINANTSTGSTNGTNISSNSVFISVNTADIGSLEDSIDTHTDTLQLHQTQIAALGPGTTYTAGNGLDLTVAEFSLGNTLTADVTFAGAFDYNIGNFTNQIERVYLMSTDISILASEASAQLLYAVDLNTSPIYKRIQLTGASALVTDSEDSKGLEYAADYSANYTDRSLVDKEYADGVAGGVTSVAAGNGLDFTTITGSGSVTMGTPSTLTLLTSNAVTTTSHTHDVNIPNVTSTVAGLAPLSGGGTSNFLRADGSWTAPAGGSGYWSRTGSRVSLANSGDSILLAANTEILAFGDISNYLWAPTSSSIDIRISGSSIMRWTSTGIYPYRSFIPGSGSIDLGSSTYDWQDLYLSRAIIQVPISAALTDGAPTDAQIDTATGTTPSSAGSGWKRLILDSNGTELMYIIISDGTNWQYTAMTKAL